MSNSSLHDKLFNEMNDIKKFHSVSPQYRFYSNQYVNKLNSLLYRGLIDKEYYSYLLNSVYSKKDTKILHTFAGLEELLKAYRPKLNELDLLYSSNLSTIKVLKALSEGICSCVGQWEVYVAPLNSRLNHIIEFIQSSDTSKDLSDKSCYYNLGILSDALFMAGKIHPNKHLPDLTECYRVIYEHVVKMDKEFYDFYEDSYLVSNIENGFSKYTDSELCAVNVTDRSTLIHHGILSPSSTFSNLDEYSYSDFLLDKCRVFCDLVTRQNKYKSLEEVNSLVLSSTMPDSLKNMCSNDLYSLRTSFIESLTSVTSSYYWYNELQCDFVYHCTPQDIEEGYEVSNCICEMLSQDRLIEFAVQQANLISIANDRDKGSFNSALYEYLFKLNEYKMIDDYKDVYNRYKQ